MGGPIKNYSAHSCSTIFIQMAMDFLHFTALAGTCGRRIETIALGHMRALRGKMLEEFPNAKNFALASTRWCLAAPQLIRVRTLRLRNSRAFI